MAEEEVVPVLSSFYKEKNTIFYINYRKLDLACTYFTEIVENVISLLS